MNPAADPVWLDPAVVFGTLAAGIVLAVVGALLLDRWLNRSRRA